MADSEHTREAQFHKRPTAIKGPSRDRDDYEVASKKHRLVHEAHQLCRPPIIIVTPTATPTAPTIAPKDLNMTSVRVNIGWVSS